MASRTSTKLLEGLRDPQNPEAWAEFDKLYSPLIKGYARRRGLRPDGMFGAW